jgi:hypothetical protein
LASALHRRPSLRVFVMRHAGAQGKRGYAAIKAARAGRKLNLHGRSPSDFAQWAISFRSGTFPNANS